MRMIDADTLNYVRVRIYHDDGTIGGYNAVVPSSEIKNAPTVDAVPVIRCKDCKFSMSGIDKYNERYILCQLHERSYGVIDDGYCKWAERKEE